ncbi:MAG: HAD-IIB family hydrolase, partial [Endomicrobiales bacterium]
MHFNKCIEPFPYLRIFSRLRGPLARKTVSLATAVCFVVSSVLGPAASAAGGEREDGALFSRARDEAVLPCSAGRITDAGYFGGKTVVVHIQDLHCHGEAQKNINALLAALDKRYGVSKVYLEGASGQVDTSWLASLRDAATAAQVAGALVERGELTGAEYYSVLSRRPSVITGIEDKEVYASNLARLNRILDEGASTRAALSALGAQLAALKRTYYSDRQRNFEKAALSYHEGRTGARKYYRLLERYCRSLGLEPGEYPHIALYLNLMEKEKGVRYLPAARELGGFVSLLRQRLPYRVYGQLAEETENFTRTDILPLYVVEAARACGVEFGRAYPALNVFLACEEARRRLDPSALVREERKLEAEITSLLAQDRSGREISFLAEYFRYCEEYCNNRIAAEDFGYYAENEGRFRLLWEKYAGTDPRGLLGPSLALRDEYYRVNLARDEVFIDALLGKALSAPRPVPENFPAGDDRARVVRSLGEAEEIKVVVAGGFHTPGLARLLKERRVSYLVLTPGVTQDPRPADEAYARLAREHRRLMAGTLALPALSQEPAAVRVEKAARALLGAFAAAQLTREEADKRLAAILESVNAQETGPQARTYGARFDLSGEKQGRYVLRVTGTGRDGKEETASSAYVADEQGRLTKEASPGETLPGPQGTALGFTRAEITAVIRGYLGQSSLLAGIFQLQPIPLDIDEITESVVNHLFNGIKGVDVLSGAEAEEYEPEREQLERIAAAHKEQNGELKEYEIKVEIARGELIPADPDTLGYATLTRVSDRRMVLRVTERFLNATREENVAWLLPGVVQHEFMEYAAFQEPGSRTFSDFDDYLWAGGGERTRESFHGYLSSTDPVQQRLLDYARRTLEREKLELRLLEDPEINRLVIKLVDRVREVLTTPARRRVFDAPADVLLIGGGSGSASIVGEIKRSFGSVQSVVNFADNAGSSGEILLDVSRAWADSASGTPPVKGAVRVRSMLQPGDLMAAVTGGIPEAWKRDLCSYRSRNAAGARELLEEAKQYVLEKYKEQIEKGTLREEAVAKYAASLAPALERVDRNWVAKNLLRMQGINHSVRNLVYLGIMDIEGAYRPGWLIPSNYFRAADKLERLLGGEAPALQSSLQSFMDANLVAKLAKRETVNVKDREKNRYDEVVTDALYGHENITGVYHASPIVSVRFLGPDRTPVTVEADREALEMIRRAKCIVIGPGSIFTSILPNLMARGVARELAKARARGVPVIFLCNTTQDAETVGHTFESLVGAIERSVSAATGEKYLFEDFVSHVVLNDAPLEDPLLDEFIRHELDEIERLKSDVTRIHEIGKYSLGLFRDISTGGAVAFLEKKGIRPVVGPFAQFTGGAGRTVQDKRKYHYTLPLLVFFLTLLNRPAAELPRFFAADVDETLAAVKAPITPLMAQRIAGIVRKGYLFAVITGNTKDSVYERVIEPLLKELGDDKSCLVNLPILANNGAEMYTYDPDSGRYEMVQSRIVDMAEEIGGQDRIETISEILKETIRHFQIPSLHGEQIEVRRNMLGGVSQVTFYATGKDSTQEEKNAYDKAGGRGKREEYAAYINTRFGHHGIRAAAKVAGKTSIDITPLGIDKAYAVRVLADYYGLDPRQILFFGDSLSPAGNDYPVTTEVGMVLNVGASPGEKLPVPTFLLEDAGPEGAERFLALLGELYKYYEPLRPRRPESAIGATLTSKVLIHSAQDLQRVISGGNLKKLIQLYEEAGNDRIREIARAINNLPARSVVLLAGPSSSGKSTLAERIRKAAKDGRTVTLNLDNYYRDRRDMPRRRDGSIDFDSPGAFDQALINRHIRALLNGETVQVPRFDMEQGVRTADTSPFSLKGDQVLFIEGILALHPDVIRDIDPERMFGIFVRAFPAPQFTLSSGENLSSADLRLVRRLVRDERDRGIKAIETIRQWPLVLEGEAEYILLSVRNARLPDENSYLPYELSVLKPNVLSLLDEAEADARRELREAEENRWKVAAPHTSREFEREKDLAARVL